MRNLTILLLLSASVALAGYDRNLENVKPPVHSMIVTSNAVPEDFPAPTLPASAPVPLASILRASVSMQSLSSPYTTTSVAPEPSTFVLLGAAFLVFAAIARKVRAVS